MPALITEDQVKQAREARDRGPQAPGDPMLRRSKDSAYMVPYWDKVDAIVDGIEAVRAAGSTYLPKFTDEESEEYNDRLKCTMMTNVYRDIIEGLASKPFEQEVKLNNPEPVEDFVNDVDGSSNTMNVFAGDLFFNGINNAIAWVFVDYSKPLPGPVSVAQARESGQRAYWSHVLARNVLDVQSKIINGRETLIYFKVYEPGDPDHIREFKRNDDGTITWTLYEYSDQRAPDSDTQYVAIESGEISIGVIPMVPFITGRRNGRTWKIFPPMKDAADLQIELYQGESGLKWVTTLTGYPMLAANGIVPERDADGTPKKLKVGPTRVLYSKADIATGKVGSWAYVEPNAEGMKFLESRNERINLQLRELGRQPLTARSGNITVITAAVAASKARSAVKQWGLLLKDSLENALRMTVLYESNTTYKPDVHVFIEFDDFMEGEDVDALNKARDRGDISQETYLEEYKRRGWLSSNFTMDRERERLLTELPGDGLGTGEM